MRPAEDMAFGTWAADVITKVIATGKFVPLLVKLMTNGLEGVTEGFQYMKDGKVSKIGYKG